MTTKTPLKKHIAQAFSRRASRYRAAAFLQKQIVSHCIDYVCDNKSTSRLWLDAGCGVGIFSELLKQKSNEIKLVSADIALLTLQQNKTKGKCVVNADIEQLPFAHGSFDGVVAASVLQWLFDIKHGLNEIKRVTNNNGQLVYGVFLKGSFKEFVALLEKRNLPVPVQYFTESEFIRMLEDAGFSSVVHKTIQETIWFQSAWNVLSYFSNIGSTPNNGPRLSKKELLGFCAEYESVYKTEKGVPLTWQVCVGKANKKQGDA
jgi:malonyl-CoA O-methyltransferase